MTLIALAAVLVLLPLLAEVPLPPGVRLVLDEHRRLQERWVARHDLSGRETARAVQRARWGTRTPTPEGGGT